MGKHTHNARVHTVYPKLEELRWFVLTVKFGNTRIAADKLGILNYAIIPNANRRIEQLVGVKLLDKNNVPTQAGEVFLKHAKRVLAAHARMLRATRKTPLSQEALLPATVHIENWLLHKLDLCKALPYEARTVITYDEPMELYEAAKKPGRRGVFIITNSNAVPNLTGQLAAVKLLDYKLRLYSASPVGLPIRWIDTDCFGGSLRSELPDGGRRFHEVGCVPNLVAVRNALLGNPGLCGYLPAEWAEDFSEVFREIPSVDVPIWLLSAVQ